MLTKKAVAVALASGALLAAGCGSDSGNDKGKGGDKGGSSTPTASAQDVKDFCAARDDLLTNVEDVSKLTTSTASKEKVKGDVQAIKDDLQQMAAVGTVLAESAQQGLIDASNTFASDVTATIQSAAGSPEKALKGLQDDFGSLKDSIQSVTSDVGC
jgi:hypothetical protein